MVAFLARASRAAPAVTHALGVVALVVAVGYRWGIQ
jgi:hypothetical protein